MKPVKLGASDGATVIWEWRIAQESAVLKRMAEDVPPEDNDDDESIPVPVRSDVLKAVGSVITLGPNVLKREPLKDLLVAADFLEIPKVVKIVCDLIALWFADSPGEVAEALGAERDDEDPFRSVPDHLKLEVLRGFVARDPWILLDFVPEARDDLPDQCIRGYRAWRAWRGDEVPALPPWPFEVRVEGLQLVGTVLRDLVPPKFVVCASFTYSHFIGELDERRRNVWNVLWRSRFVLQELHLDLDPAFQLGPGTGEGADADPLAA